MNQINYDTYNQIESTSSFYDSSVSTINIENLDFIHTVITDIKLWCRSIWDTQLDLMLTDLPSFQLYNITYNLLSKQDAQSSVEYVDYIFNFKILEFSPDEWNNCLKIIRDKYCEIINRYIEIFIEELDSQESNEFYSKALLNEDDGIKLYDSVYEIVNTKLSQFYRLAFSYIQNFQSYKVQFKQLFGNTQNEKLLDLAGYGSGLAVSFANPPIGLAILISKYFYGKSRDKNKEIFFHEMIDSYGKVIEVIENSKIGAIRLDIEKVFIEKLDIYFSSFEAGIKYFHNSSKKTEIEKALDILSNIAYNKIFNYEKNSEGFLFLLVIDNLLENNSQYKISNNFRTILEGKRNDLRQLLK